MGAEDRKKRNSGLDSLTKSISVCIIGLPKLIVCKTIKLLVVSCEDICAKGDTSFLMTVWENVVYFCCQV